LLPKGQRTFRDAERRHGSRVAKLFAPLSHGELATFLRILDKLRGSIRETDGPMSSRPRPAAVTVAKRRAQPKR
jgi:hypothetical protein